MHDELTQLLINSVRIYSSMELGKFVYRGRNSIVADINSIP